MFRSIWITGASAGIGKALSKYYAAPGVTLGLVAHKLDSQDGVVPDCRKRGATVYAYEIDVSDCNKSRDCALDFLGHVGYVDLVIANAGIRIEEDPDYKDCEIPMRVMSTNYQGVINTFVPFIHSMKERRQGYLAAISSIGAFRGTPNSGAYSASKAAVNVWAESLRLRLKPHGIHVSTLCPGFVDTAMNAGLSFWMPGLISTQYAAQIIASSIERRRRVVTFPWQANLIWFILRILPGRVYDFLILYAQANRHIREHKTK